MELEFELWAGLRYNFFAAAPPPVDTWKSQLDFQVDVESRGLHIADSSTDSINWKEYEQEIVDYFRSEYPAAMITPNVRLSLSASFALCSRSASPTRPHAC
jgi:hypothetical protein